MTGLRCVVPALPILSAFYAVLVHWLMALIRFAHPAGWLCQSSPLRSGAPSLPSHGRSPFRSWLQIVLWLFHSSDRGLEPLLVSVHAGHTQAGATNRLPAESRKRHDNHNLNLEIEGALPVACGRPLTFGNNKGWTRRRNETDRSLVLPSSSVAFFWNLRSKSIGQLGYR